MSTENKKWYILQVAVGKEETFKKALLGMIVDSNKKEFFGDIIVPTEEIIEIVNGKKRITKRRFFPGYVLINVMMTEEILQFFNAIKVPRHLGFLGSRDDKIQKRTPNPISDQEIAAILNKMEDNIPKHKEEFEVGESVRITSGSFENWTGVISEVDYNKNVVKVKILIFNKDTDIQLSFKDIERNI